LNRYDLIVTSAQFYLNFHTAKKASHGKEGKTVKKQAAIYAHTLTLITLTVALLITAGTQPCVASADSPSSFSIIWITDTQYLSESHPEYYGALCRWIVDNKDTYNVKMVVHTGDLVNQEGNRTQWASANQSMSILLANGVPYCWNAGNHDYNATCWIGNQFSAFNPQMMQAKPYWVSDAFDGMNTAVRFDVAGWDCLIVNIAYNANDTVLAWANNLLDSNPQSHVIVAMHAYINRYCQYDSWATNFKNSVLDIHTNVFLTLSGHYYPTSGNRTCVGNRDELLFNQQDTYEQTGAASARILTFDIATGTVTVQTYVLNASQFLQDPDNNFTLETDFRNDLAGKSPYDLSVIAVLVASLSFAALCSVYLWKARVKKGAKKTLMDSCCFVVFD